MCCNDLDTGKALESYYDNALKSKTAISATEATLWGFHFWNTNASTAYVQLFNASATGDVTLGTTTPDLVFAVPASGGYDWPISDKAIKRFSSGIVVAITTTDEGATEVTTGLLSDIFFYND